MIPMPDAARAHEFGRTTHHDGAAIDNAARRRFHLTSDLLARVLVRATQQAFLEALPSYWLGRAEQLEAVGTSWADAAAANCRRHAWLLAQALPDEVSQEIHAHVTGAAA